MRRVKDRDAPLDAGLLVSPGEIIARAAATVPPEAAAEPSEAGAKVEVWTPPRGADDTIAIAPAAPMRRARRRPADTLRYAWFYASRGALAAALLAGTIGLAVWLFKSGVITDAGREAAETYADLKKRADLGVSVALDRLLVEGRNRTTRADLRAALRIRKGDNLVAADPWAIKRRLEKLPWIRSATVERRYPNAMMVTLVERNPIARFHDGTRTVLVDEDGALIAVAPEKEHESLILLAGDGAPEAAAALLKLLADEAALGRRVISAARFGQRRWDLTFEGGAVLRLPDSHAKAALAKFGEFDRQHSLIGRGAVTYDMRLPDRMVIRNQRSATPAVAPEKPAPAKKPKRTG